VDLLT